jgi:hypothetical protein
MVVDIEDRFRVRGTQRIEKYWYWMKKYVLKRIGNMNLEYDRGHSYTLAEALA